MTAARPPVYSIVVNYNGWKDTIECVDSLLRSDYPDLRVWVLDNASTDDSWPQLTRWAAAAHGDTSVAGDHSLLVSGTPTRLVLARCGANLGFAGACNVALPAASREPGCMALLLNNDAVIAPDAVSAMVAQALGTESLGALGATVLRHDRPDEVEMLGGATVKRASGMVTPAHAGIRGSTALPPGVRLDYVSGCCLLVPASTIERVGLMDERYFLYSEDVDWGLRMRAAGLTLAYCPAARVWHKGGASVGHHTPLHDYYMVRGALLLVRTHATAMLPYALLHWLVRGILSKLARREWARLRAAASGYRDFLRGSFAPNAHIARA